MKIIRIKTGEIPLKTNLQCLVLGSNSGGVECSLLNYISYQLTMLAGVYFLDELTMFVGN